MEWPFSRARAQPFPRERLRDPHAISTHLWRDSSHHLLEELECGWYNPIVGTLQIVAIPAARHFVGTMHEATMIELALSFLVGAASSWLVTHLYYRKALRDSRDTFMLSRLDQCNDGDLAFLLALYCAGRKVPRYAVINVEYTDAKGEAHSFGSSMGTMVRSVEHRVSQCIVLHSEDTLDEDEATVTLTNRGRECAEFVRRTKFPSASFTMIDDSRELRTAHFKQEHKREPQRATGHSGIRN
jgi:hypothetical protein